MINAQPLDPICASLFHAGNTCPCCQESVAANQWIITCPQCSSIHHQSCWTRKNGCSSYHCNAAVHSNAGELKADIVINSEEVAKVYVPVPPPRRSGQDAAAPYLPKKPDRLSRVALVSALFAGCSLFGVIGTFTGSAPVLAIGIALSMAALILGVIALVIINTPQNRVYGFPLASGGILCPAILLVVYFVSLGSHFERHSQQMVNLQFSESLPSPEQLAHMNVPAANAMRANVVIECSNGMLSEGRYGSGIITRLDGRKAYIVTNKHVVGENPSVDIQVVFFNGEKSKAKVEWLAPAGADVAVIGCQVLSLDKYVQVLPLDELLGPGEKVFAVGNPMQLPWSYTEGTISGLRKSTSANQILDLYQTQTPINSGNSGGGLYTVDGKLIGINSLTENKAISEGLNFAIAMPGVLKLLTKEERDRFFGANAPIEAEKKGEF